MNQTLNSQRLVTYTLVQLMLILVLFTGNTFAQSATVRQSPAPNSVPHSTENNLFSGKWELVGIPADAGFSYQKVFNDAGEFANYRVYPNDIVRTHYGKYVIKDKSTFLEIVATETDESRSHVAGQTTTILYKFSDDKKLLSIKGLAVNGNSTFEETWRRIELPVVSSKPLKTSNNYQ